MVGHLSLAPCPCPTSHFSHGMGLHPLCLNVSIKNQHGMNTTHSLTLSLISV